MAIAKEALWESGHDESVEVNQRALIDKVLARYSGEFTVFRELLQNSSDAASKRVEIHFETEAYLAHKNSENGEGPSGEWKLPDLKTTKVHQWSFKNDGMIFRDEDWSRLKKIAEGNPDEEKIGAFGVGFYSLFSVTEEPFVTSGGQWMGFYWKDKKDQLFARRGAIPRAQDKLDPWTTFTMPLRDPAACPTPFDFVRFITSSITFVAHLSDVSVWFDGHRLARITRERGAPNVVGLRSGLKTDSSKGTMRAAAVEQIPLSIKAEVMYCVYVAGSSKPRRQVVKPPPKAEAAVTSGFFSSLFSSLTSAPRPSNPAPSANATVTKEIEQAREAAEQIKLLEVTETSVLLSVFAVDINVKLDEKMRQELQRATKKNPPSKMRITQTGKDEYDASKKEDSKQPEATGSIFQGLRADIDGTGTARVFIGHTTGQTTGIGGHIAARFIPTVERESVDLVDRNVRVWNEELLDMGGYLARAAYEIEMDHVRTLWKGGSGATTAPDDELQKWLRERALHALKFFTFYPSTPLERVSSLLEQSFFSCAVVRGFSFLGATGTPPFPIMSTVGVHNAADVRMPNDAFSGFLKNLPLVPKDILEDAKKMIDSLRERNMLKDINFADVTQELASRPLTEPEMIACIKWWLGVYTDHGGSKPQLDRIRTELLNAAVLVVGTPGSGAEQMVPMSTIQTFLNTRGAGAHIPSDGPLPSHLLRLTISRNFDPVLLSSALGWSELSIVDWLRHILDDEVALSHPEYDPTKSTDFADRLLNILAKVLPVVSKSTVDAAVQLLQPKACIPTSLGLRLPQEAYFQTAHIFSDLPLVKFTSESPIKGNLEKILLALGVRKHVDLQIVFDRMIKTGDWTTADLVKYLVAVQTTLTSAELERLRMTSAFPKEVTGSDALEKAKVPRCKASDLYEPLDTFKELGLPIIDWGGRTKWRGNTDEAKFLFNIGLRRFPPLEALVSLAASENEKIRPVALKYLLDNIPNRYNHYHPNNFAHLAFIPAVKGDTHDIDSLRPEDVSKLRVQDHPPTTKLLALLQNSPPENSQTAKTWFQAMGVRVSEFSSSELKTLSEMLFVPVEQSDTSQGRTIQTNPSVRLLAPGQCYFKGDSNAQVHSKLFVFVDFGPGANLFLSACGTKREPSVEEIARILLDNPRRFFELCEGRDNFLIELRNVAVNRRGLSQTLLTLMKRNPILLASRRTRKNKKDTKRQSIDHDEEEDWDLEYDLLKPDAIVIADDTNAYQHFGDAIFAAPQDDLLEDFYMELGSRRLSALVKEKYKTSAEIKHSRKPADIRNLILERLPLFLHEHSHAKVQVPYSWLNTEANFVVRAFGKITVIKTLNFGQVASVKNQDASAVALREGRGPIQLWLADNDLLDMYEVSTSMCRLLFQSPKASDALLFMTILSTDLRALRRRGYNVDRILRKQKAERLAADDAARENAQQMALLGSSKDKPLPPPIPDNQSASVATSGLEAPIPTNHNWRRKFTVKDGPGPEHTMPGGLPGGNDELVPPMAPSAGSVSRPRTPSATVTPQSNIAANIDMAIRACREERGQVLQNHENMQVVKEALNEGYCDISGRTGNLKLLGEMGGIKIFASQEVQDPSSVLTNKDDTIARFIHIIQPLANVYGLPPTSLHIFYDLSGDLIAFNRNASLFLNLRFFEAWHDAEVKAGDLSKAYISWYFTLAHEIAHNLVQPHNSEHEFYFSSICEARLPAFSKLLAST
ncbi:hypothetical protein EUX98_g5023 [Antrodiella citrinella]|uniref:Sacsin/Nov domain-containing protein n=1 Tax=Antrodiella citrinella TaxID=2447956 RepID=A0A4S4MSS0_9APHY|nr:hypothetical protein EUX98_g5023 [Antrodiella citrinella]